MKWLEVHIDTNHTGLETVEAFLSAHGIDNVIIDDEGEFRSFVEENRACWGEVDEDLIRQEQGRSRVTFYLEETDAGFAALAALRIALTDFKKEHGDCGSLLLTMENMEDADWENNWKQFYKPMEIGDRLIVIPEWESAGVPEGRVALRLNPGLTFGTGSHATTRLCLTALEKHVRGGETVLDLGCGSGILSIAALLLGADRAVACDIDEKCMDVAYENAALNGVGRDRYTVRWGDVVTDRALRRELGGPYDVVVANIVADVIKALASTVRPLVREGGIFLCSGIIDDRAEEVQEKLRQAGLTILESRLSDGWLCCVCG
jgi:ribosomal protein L11 methyltransferase